MPVDYDYHLEHHQMKLTIPFVNQRWSELLHKPQRPNSNMEDDDDLMMRTECEDETLRKFGDDKLGTDGFYISGTWSCTHPQVRAEMADREENGGEGFHTIRDCISRTQSFPGRQDTMVVEDLHFSISGHVQRALKQAKCFDDDGATFRAIQNCADGHDGVYIPGTLNVP